MTGITVRNRQRGLEFTLPAPAYVPLSQRPAPPSHVNQAETMEEFVGQCALLWRISDWQWKAGNKDASASAAEAAAEYQMALRDRMLATETYFLQANSITAWLEWNTWLRDQWVARLKDAAGKSL